MSGSSEPDSNPFVGPRAIQTGEALYGRSRELGELYAHLQGRRIVVLHSPSGAGKSSLVQAGLIPLLRANHYDVWKPVRVNLEPEGLAGVSADCNRYLLSAMVSLEDELPAEHRRSPAQLAGLDFRTYLETRPRRKHQARRPVVLLFDQFEEVLTVAPLAVAAKRAFFAGLGQALDVGSYWALFIIREDYLAALAPYRDHLPTQLSNSFRLDLLGLEGAKETAEQLALAGGRSFPAVEELVRNLSMVQVQRADGSFASEQGNHVEPVQLQVVCRRLWAAMPAEARSIEAADIEAYADVSTSLADYYASAVQRIAAGERAGERAGKQAGKQAGERALREWVGQRLIVGGIRSQVRQGPGRSGGLDNGLIEQLLHSYLVRAEQRAGATWYELSHDRLVEPVTQDNAAWEHAHLHPLQLQAKRWEAGKRDPGLLLPADELRDALKWASANPALLTASEREFLDASQRLRRAQTWARRKRWVWAGLLTTTVVAASAEGYRRFEVRQELRACEATGAEIDEIWDAEREQALRDGLVGTGGELAATTADKVLPRFAKWAQEWREARVETCLDAVVRERWNAGMEERSLWCLDEGKMALGALVDQLTAADKGVLQNAVAAAVSLESVAGCRNELVLEQREAPQADVRDAVRAVRAEVAKARALEQAGRYDAGLAVARAALERAQALGWRPLTAAARLRVGSLLVNKGAYADAEALMEQAYFEAMAGGASALAFEAARRLVSVVGNNLARHEEGLRWGRHAETALAVMEDGQGLQRAALLDSLGTVHEAAGAYEEAKALHERALLIYEEVLGPEHLDVAVCLDNLANVYQEADSSEQAKAMYERSLAIYEEVLGPEHPDVAASLNNLGIVYQESGSGEQAKLLYERALAIYEKTLDPEHPDVSDTIGNLASVYGEFGDYQQAKLLYERALAIREKALGPEHPRVASSLSNLAGIYRELGSYQEAKAMYERSLAISERVLGPEHPDVANTLNNLAILYLNDLDDLEQAKVMLERALAIREETLGPDHRYVAYSLDNLASIYMDTHSYEEAKGLYERALAIYDESDPKHPDADYALAGLARIAVEQHRPADAIPYALRVVAMRELAELDETSRWRLADARFLLARALWDAPADAGRDRARAVTEAQAAHGLLRDNGDGETEEFAAVEAWLKTHRG